MGRSKQKRKIKRKKKAEKRREIRKKMGKPLFLTLQRTPRPLRGFSNRYTRKATLHRVSYSKGQFENVKWHSSHITSCSFAEAQLIGVDFSHCNLKNTSFRNAYLEDVTFFDCKLERTNFKNAIFQNVVFMSTDLENAVNLNKSQIQILTAYPYPPVALSEMEAQALLSLSEFPEIFQARVLHVNRRKLNLWSLHLLTDAYGADALRALIAVKRRQNKKFFYTIYSYKKHIDRYLKL